MTRTARPAQPALAALRRMSDAELDAAAAAADQAVYAIAAGGRHAEDFRAAVAGYRRTAGNVAKVRAERAAGTPR